MTISDHESLELGRNFGDMFFNKRMKEEQLYLLNQLFGGIGDKIRERKRKLVKNIEIKNYIPENLVFSFL